MPKFGLGGKADADVDHPDLKVEGEIPDISIDGDKPSAKFGVKMPKFGLGGKADTDVDHLDLKVEGKVSDISIDGDKPSAKFGVKMPKFGFGGKADVDVDHPDLKVEGKAPDISIDGDKPSAKFGVKMPKLGFGGKADVDVDQPDLKVEGKMPDISIDGEKNYNVDKPSAKFGVKMPKFGFGGKADVNVYHPDLKVEGEMPDISIDNDKNYNVDKPSAKFGVKMPQFGFGGKADIDVDHPDLKVEGEMPDISIDGDKPSAKFGVKVPKFGLGGEAGVSGKADLDVDRPHFKVDSEKPDFSRWHQELRKKAVDHPDLKVKGEMPDISIDGDKPSAKFGVKMPKFGLGGKADADVDHPDLKVEGKVPDISIDGDKPSAKFGVKMPKLGFGGKSDASVDHPDLKAEGKVPDISFDSDKPSAKFGVKMPKFGLGGKADVDVDHPDLKVDGEIPDIGIDSDKNYNVDKPSAKFGVKIPKFGLGGKADVDVDHPDLKVEGKLPDISIDGDKPSAKFGVKMPKFGLGGKADVDVDHPDLKVDGKFPDISIDGDKPSAKFGVKMPKFGLGGKADVDVDHPDLKVEGGIPDISISGDKKYNVEKPSAKFGVKMPKFGLGGKADVDVDHPDLKVGGEVPDISNDGDKPSAKFGVKMPKFGLSGKADVDVDHPDMKVEGKVPDISIVGDKPSAKIGVKMPKFGLGGKADVDVDHPDLKVKGEMPDISIGGDKPSAKFGVKMPKFGFGGKADADVDHPDLKVEGSKKFEIKMPKVGFNLKSDSDSKHIQSPQYRVMETETDYGMKMPKYGLGASLSEVDAHEAEIDISTGKVEYELPEVDICGESDLTTEKHGMNFGIQMPKFGLSGKSDVNINQPKGEFSQYDVKVGGKMPDVDINKEKSLDDNIGMKFGMKMPKHGVSGKVDLDVDRPHFKVDSEKPDFSRWQQELRKKALEVDCPKADMDVDVDIGGKANWDAKEHDKKFEVNLPKFGLRGQSDVEIKRPKGKLPQYDVKVGGMSETDIAKEIGDDDRSGMKFGLKMPKFGFGGNADIDVDHPDLKSEFEKPAVSIDGNKIAKIEKPGIKFGIKMPKTGSGDKPAEFDHLGGKVDLDVPSSKVDFDRPNVDVNVRAGIDDYKMPTYDIGSSLTEINAYGVEVEPNVAIDRAEFESKLKSSAPVSIDLKHAGIKSDIQKPEFDVNREHNKSGITLGVKMPEFGISNKSEFGIDHPVEARVEKSTIEFDVKEKSDIKYEMKVPKFGGEKLPTNIGDMEGSTVEFKGERDDRMKFPVIGMAYTDIKQSDVKVNEYDITADGKIKTKTDSSIDLKQKGMLKTDLGKYETNVLATEGKVLIEAPNIESLQIKSKHGDIPTFGRESTISGSIPESSIGPDQPRLTKFGMEISKDVGFTEDKVIEGVKVYDPKLSGHMDIGKDQPRLPKFGEAGVKVHLPDRKTEFEQKGKLITKSNLSETERPSSLGSTDFETSYSIKSNSDKIIVDPSRVDTDITNRIGEIIPGVSMIHVKDKTVGVTMKTKEGKYPNIGWNVGIEDESTHNQTHSIDSGVNFQTAQYRASEKREIHPDGTVHSFVLSPEENEKDISYSSHRIGGFDLSAHESSDQSDSKHTSKRMGSISTDMRGFLGTLLTDIPDSTSTTVTTTVSREVPIKYEISSSQKTIEMPGSEFEVKYGSPSSKDQETITKDFSYTIPEGMDPETYLKAKLGPFTLTPERTLSECKTEVHVIEPSSLAEQPKSKYVIRSSDGDSKSSESPIITGTGAVLRTRIVRSTPTVTTHTTSHITGGDSTSTTQTKHIDFESDFDKLPPEILERLSFTGDGAKSPKQSRSVFVTEDAGGKVIVHRRTDSSFEEHPSSNEVLRIPVSQFSGETEIPGLIPGSKQRVVVKEIRTVKVGDGPETTVVSDYKTGRGKESDTAILNVLQSSGFRISGSDESHLSYEHGDSSGLQFNLVQTESSEQEKPEGTSNIPYEVTQRLQEGLTIPLETITSATTMTVRRIIKKDSSGNVIEEHEETVEPAVRKVVRTDRFGNIVQEIEEQVQENDIPEFTSDDSTQKFVTTRIVRREESGVLTEEYVSEESSVKECEGGDVSSSPRT